jgi:hypothetical protein
MTTKTASNNIRKLLDSLAKQKTDKDKLWVLFKIKVEVECAEEPLKRRSDKRQAAFDKKTQIIRRALKDFLTALDKIFAKHEELGDSQVRDEMFAAIIKGFIKPERAYKLPAKFGMFSEEANLLVHAAIQRFLDHPEVITAKKVLKSPDERLNAFQDDTVKTKETVNFIEYFGIRNTAVV